MPAAQKRKRIPVLPFNVSTTAAPIPIIQKAISQEWITVTPELATKWLEEFNTNNRNIREDHVVRLANDMKAGKWKRNGESIAFDVNNRLIDGQHRLYACFMAQKPFDTLIMRGLDPEVYSTRGIGRPKNFGDFLGPVHGEKNTALLASLLRMIYFWEHGYLARMKEGSLAPTISQLEQVLIKHPKSRDSVEFVSNHSAVKTAFPPSYSCLIHYVGTRQGHPATVESFLERLGNGLGLNADDPVYQLRKFMLAQRGAKPGTRRAAQLYVLALGIKAWNAVKSNKPLRVLRLGVGEEFPSL